MHSKFKLALALCVASFPLAGCSSLLGLNLSKQARAVPAEAPTPEPLAAFNGGRQHLEAGRTGLAIEMFQRSLGIGEPIAPALNGLGVAYARLGRYDLAKRFFEEAVAADPANINYRHNVERLMASMTFAIRADAGLAQADGSTSRDTGMKDQVAVPGKFHRLSRGEVHIRTVPAQAAPRQRHAAIAAGLPKMAAVMDPVGFKPVIRMELPGTTVQAKVAP